MYSDHHDLITRPFQLSLPLQTAPGAYSSLPLSSLWGGQKRSSTVYIPQLVELQASVLPEKLALVMGEQKLTYRELNQRANQLAHYLQTLGVGPETLVGVCMERSSDFVVGLLGILKAGAAYLPLDPSYPEERLAFMLSDSQAAVVLTHEALLPLLSATRAHVLCLDSDSELLEAQNTENLLPTLNLDTLVYVIYTSGSTGQPKGVEIPHGGLLNLINWHQQVFAVSAENRATQVAGPAFDAAGWEIWPYLTIGATLYLPDEETRVTPPLLRDWLVRNEITHAFLPTMLAESMLLLEWPEQTALRFLLTGADTLHHYPSATLPFVLVNNYGPTESSVVATSGIIPATTAVERAPSIGRPILNTHIYILDEQLQPVPTGAPGEIYIGGAGLARGYLNRPELTAERFILYPAYSEPANLSHETALRPAPGARLYKTGDLACFLPDGQIAFMGRSDQQVKIRGYRIELGEIASVLESHEAVQMSRVLAREDLPGEKRLIAYLMLVPETSVTARELRDHVLQRLPDYMLPTAFIALEAFPLTANGKLDSAALPAPDETNTLRDQEQQGEPLSLTEQRVSQIICTLLNLHEVGLDDNFFMLGGHSLLGTQIIARIAELFAVNLTLRSLFEAPTVRELAAEIEEQVLKKFESMSNDEIMELLK